MNFGTMSDTELLLTYCRIIDQIRQRELHSPGGNPIAGYAELLASERLDLQLYPDETIGFDAKDRATGETYQIKHTRNPKSTPPNRHNQQSRWQAVRLPCVPDFQRGPLRA